MLGFNGFERHFVEMVAKHYSKDLFTIAAMRGVSRAWRAGSETQWNRMKVKWVLSTSSMGDITVFEKDESVLKAGLLDACKRNPQIIIDILKAKFDPVRNAFEATLSAANDSETIFDLFYNEDEFCLNINFENFIAFGNIQIDAHFTDYDYTTINVRPTTIVRDYVLQFLRVNKRVVKNTHKKICL
jgi:hypothetical protein